MIHHLPPIITRCHTILNPSQRMGTHGKSTWESSNPAIILIMYSMSGSNFTKRFIYARNHLLIRSALTCVHCRRRSTQQGERNRGGAPEGYRREVPPRRAKRGGGWLLEPHSVTPPDVRPMAAHLYPFPLQFSSSAFFTAEGGTKVLRY